LIKFKYFVIKIYFPVQKMRYSLFTVFFVVLVATSAANALSSHEYLKRAHPQPKTKNDKGLQNRVS
jgi:hypothetical protein